MKQRFKSMHLARQASGQAIPCPASITTIARPSQAKTTAKSGQCDTGRCIVPSKREALLPDRLSTMKVDLTQGQLLLIHGLCADAEERCAARAGEARARNDASTLSYELQLREHYEDLRMVIRTLLDADAISTQDLQDDIRRLAQSMREKDIFGKD
jgi:hypothetical protein